MSLRFCLFVPVDDLERVGHWGFFSPESRLYARLGNVPGVQRVDISYILELRARPMLRTFVVEMKPQPNDIDRMKVRLAVEDAVKDFIAKLAKATA